MTWVFKTAAEQLRALRGGEVSAVELLEATIDHAQQLAPVINPFALTLYDRARRAAVKADRLIAKGKAGALGGLPVTIKDSQWLAGYPCANGSHTLQSFVPAKTCRAVTRLERAGAVIFAKTTCPEFCVYGVTESELFGRTRNPWNHGRTAGGSSGGAAAAVAAGLGSLSLGGDGGGSIRIPAAFCGIVGFKPSFGIVPRGPGFPTWETIVAYGPMARNISDTALMFSVLTGQANVLDEPGFALDKIKMAASPDLGFAPVDTDVAAAFSQVLELLGGAGANLVDAHPGLGSSIQTWVITAAYDMWEAKKDALPGGRGAGPRAREFIQFGGTFERSDFDAAQRRRDTIKQAYMDLFQKTGASVILTPTLGCEAFPHGTTHPLTINGTEIEYPWLDWAGFLYDANLAGMPACAIPMGIGDEGLPLSLQIMGPPGADGMVLNVAAAIECLVGWRHPEFHAHSPADGLHHPTDPTPPPVDMYPRNGHAR